MEPPAANVNIEGEMTGTCEKPSESSLGDKQRLFSKKVAILILYAYEQGYEITFGDAFATDGHSRMSCHYIRLAVDLNLFKDGVYLRETSDHQLLGEFWEDMGGSWGGRFNDGNHYSLEHDGRK